MDSETIEQPSYADGVGAWAKYAGRLRQAVGELRRERDELGEKLRMTTNAKRRDARLLSAVEKDLAAGDIPAAVDRLAWRRSAINARSEMRSTPLRS